MKKKILKLTSLYLFVKHDPSVSNTARDVKFSDAIISKPRIFIYYED